MKKRTRKNWKTSTGVQLSLWSWVEPRPKVVNKAKNGGCSHHKGPNENYDPFTDARGYIPAYGRRAPNDAKQIE